MRCRESLKYRGYFKKKKKEATQSDLRGGGSRVKRNHQARCCVNVNSY